MLKTLKTKFVYLEQKHDENNDPSAGQKFEIGFKM